MGTKYWETIAYEHGLEPTGQYKGESDTLLEKIEVCFSEESGGRFIPRVVLTDLETGAIDDIKSGAFGKFFSPNSYVTGKYGASHNWAKGYYSEGENLFNAALDAIQKEVEACDSLQGFQFTHSLGGGTGSGFGTLLVDKVKEIYPDSIVSAFSVYPYPKEINCISEIYNSILTNNHLIDNIDMIHTLDTSSLQQIITRTLKPINISNTDLNNFISLAMSGVTCTLRFPSELNETLRKLAINLMPFPRAHFTMFGFSPLPTFGAQQYKPLTTAEHTLSTFNSKNMMTGADPMSGRYLGSTVIYRGKFSLRETEDLIQEFKTINSSSFTEWLPDNLKTTICNIPCNRIKTSAISILNTTAIQELFRRLDMQFIKLFRRKTFLHWYLQEGMEEMDFIQAHRNIIDLVSEYQQYQDATIEDNFGLPEEDELDLGVDSRADTEPE
jgi:tubulin beta